MTAKESIMEELRRQKNAISDINIQSRKQEWIESLSHLFDTLSEWTRDAEAEGLLSREDYDAEISEEPLGTYTVPALRLMTPAGDAVEIRPRSMFITGASGRVDWEGSSGRKAMLIRSDSNEWEFVELQRGGHWYYRPLSEETCWETIGHLLD